MLAFNGMVLTNQGLALQAKVLSGATLNFTKLKVGDGVLETGQSLETLTDLISPKQNVPINNCTVVNGEATISGTLSNANTTAGFMVNEIGVFATDPQAGEILYAVANAGGQCDYLPAGGGAVVVESVLNVVLAVGNAANVTAVVNSAIFVTQADLLSHIQNQNNPHKVTAAQVAALPLAGGNLTGAINETAVTMASASIMNIGAAAGNVINVTGSNTINGFDAIQAGTRRKLRFASPLTITYNAASLILPGAANMIVAAGDVVEFTSAGSGNWRMTGYMPASGKYNPVVASASVVGGVKAGTGITIAADGTISATGNLIIGTGTVADGATVPLPAGATSHAGIAIWPHDTNSTLYNWDIEEGGRTLHNSVIQFQVNQTTRVVKCGAYYNEHRDQTDLSQAVWKPGIAGYLILGVA